MPLAEDSASAHRIRVRPSALLELFWVGFFCAASHELRGMWAHLEPARQELGEELRSFWEDGYHCYTELAVLAHRAGTLLDLDLDRFLERLETVSAAGGPHPGLRTEPSDEREALVGRLERLRREAPLRRRYHQLLDRLWATARPQWESDGRAAVQEAATGWAARLAEGDRSLLSTLDVWPDRTDLAQLVEGALRGGGTLVVSPGWYFGRRHVIEVAGTVYFGRSMRFAPDLEVQRAAARAASERLRVLSDPTRVAILLALGERPATIAETAKRFRLSQPTVSIHVRLLRQSGLVEAAAGGPRGRLTTRPELLHRLLAEAEESLLGALRS